LPPVWDWLVWAQRLRLKPSQRRFHNGVLGTSGTLVGAPIGSGGSATKIGGDLDLIPIPIRTGDPDGDLVVLALTRADLVDRGGDPAGRVGPVVLDLIQAGLGDLALDRVDLVVLALTRVDPAGLGDLGLAAPADLAVASTLATAPQHHSRISV
jgi:hypothetical protein